MYKDIDEAIKQLTENYNFWMQFACDDCLEEGEHKVNNCEENANSCYQIIRWLEELKAFRKNKTDAEKQKIRTDAIDECIELIEHGCFISGTAGNCLRRHMEQLKEKKE